MFCYQLNRGQVFLLVFGLLAAGLADVAAALGPGAEVFWTEDFADDPLAAGRFSVPPDHSAGRFTYDAQEQFLIVHYDTVEPTAWYMRPIDLVGGRTLGRYDGFEFTVTFRIRSEGFYADPNGFAQIAWGLVNSQTSGDDRAGGSAGPYAYDCATFDFFPNVSPLYGGPTVGPTVIHSDDGEGFFANIDFSFGAETTIDTESGDETILLDTAYTALVAYSGADQTATVTLYQGDYALMINADGDGGYGGFDGDATTVQTILVIDNPFTVDTFALTAWQDTYCPGYSSVVADVDVTHIEFFAPEVLLFDMNLDSKVDGRDIATFVALMLSPDPDPELVARGDWNENGSLDLIDVENLVNMLLQP